MKAGAAQVEITPLPGLELTGFFNREQPSVGVRDPLFVRALFLEQADRRLLWLHADLLGLERTFVRDFRTWANRELGLAPAEVMLTATHTHCGPAIVPLLGCGRRDEAYVAGLPARFEQAARQAAAAARPVRLVTAEGALELSADRRRKPTALTDPRVAAAGWIGEDGRYVAAAVVYAMHPVALGGIRLVSADWPGRAADTLARLLPGAPVALVSGGASGNLNPPRCGAPEEEMIRWGDAVAAAAAAPLKEAIPQGNDAVVASASRTVALAADAWPAEAIERRAAVWKAARPGDSPLDRRYREVVETWRRHRLEALERPDHDRLEAELMAVRLGPLALAGVNAEVFTQFTARVRGKTGRAVHGLGCCNGVFGYLPHDAAYDEGGYEPDSAFLYYDAFRPARGGLERLAETAAELVGVLYDGHPERTAERRGGGLDR